MNYESKMVKIILDTNVIISYLISKPNIAFERIVKDAKAQRLILFCSTEIWSELLEALKYPKIAMRLPSNYGTFVTKYKFLCKFVEPKLEVEVCRDPRDNKFLELALDTEPDYIITGDKDLLELNTFENTTILTLKDYTENPTQQKRD